MKKVTILAAVILATITSCQKPLPENIKNARESVNNWQKLVNQEDSLICSLTQDKIDALPTDSIMKLMWLDNSLTKTHLKNSENTLEELLIHNPEYSSYEEVKNSVPSYLYSKKDKGATIDKHLTNMKYLRDVYLYRTAYFKPDEKPKYGFFVK